jgi:undecaprenyl-diphosphatase
VAAAGLASNLLKHLIGRARPKLFEEVGAVAFDPLAFDFKWNSLPSGHAATLFALATALALLAPRRRAAVYAVAAVGAFSRVAVAAHYPTDVLAGAALGHYGTRALAAGAAVGGVLFGPDLAPRAPALAAAALRRLGASFAEGARAMLGRVGRAGAAP